MTDLHRFGAALGVMAVLLGGPLALAVEPNPHLSRGTLVIAERVILTMELARTLGETVRGLSGRPGLESGPGMPFVFDRPQPISIWKQDMRFLLDIIWIREGWIVQINKQASPLTLSGPERIPRQRRILRWRFLLATHPDGRSA